MRWPDQPGEGEVVLVRGGTLRDPDVLREKLTEDEFSDGYAVLSVFGAVVSEHPSKTEAIAQAVADGAVCHNKIQVGDLASMLANGLRVVREGEPGDHESHHHVYFRLPVQQWEIDVWLDCMSEPQLKP